MLVAVSQNFCFKIQYKFFQLLGQHIRQCHCAIAVTVKSNMAYIFTAWSNSIMSLKEIPLSCHITEDKLANEELGQPRPNLNIKYLQREGNHITRDFQRAEWEMWLAVCKVGNALFCYVFCSILIAALTQHGLLQVPWRKSKAWNIWQMPNSVTFCGMFQSAFHGQS